MTDTHASHHGNRVEDHRLVTGAGKYAADWNLPGQLYAAFVRAVSGEEPPPDLVALFHEVLEEAADASA